jgi:hypothetical protein
MRIQVAAPTDKESLLFFMGDFRELSPQKGACQLWEKKRLGQKMRKSL